MRRPAPLGSKPKPKPKRNVFTTLNQPPRDAAVDVAERRLWVVGLARAGMTLNRIIDQGTARRPIPLDATEVSRVYADYLREIKAQFAAEVPAARAAQVERLMFDLARLRAGALRFHGAQPITMQSPDGKMEFVRNYDYAAIGRHERLLMDILGTDAPKRIEVDANIGINVGAALANVFVNVTSERFEEIVQHQAALERDASTARNMALNPRRAPAVL